MLSSGCEFSKVFCSNFGAACIYCHPVIQANLDLIWKRLTGSYNPHLTDETTVHVARVTQQECGIAGIGIQVSSLPTAL